MSSTTTAVVSAIASETAEAARRLKGQARRSHLSRNAGAGGQQGAPSVTADIYAACMKLRETVAQRLGFDTPDVDFADGQARSGSRSVKLADAAGTVTRWSRT